MSSVVISGDTSGQITLAAPAVSGTNTITLPAATGTMLTTAGGQTITGNTTVSGTVVMGSPFTMRNKIINGAMVIDQRNAGASVNSNFPENYTLDRWVAIAGVASKFSIQQNAGSVTPPSGFNNYLGITSLSAYTLSSSDYFGICQRIEGFNTVDLGWGAAGAQSVTLSFWVRSSLTGTFGGVINNYNATRSYPFSYTISSANTWEQKTVTIAGDTSGTWLKTNGGGLLLVFALGVGATYSGPAGSWAATNYASATGATSVVGTNGATFYITGVQLEIGTAATPFEYRNYQQELAMCQRYYQKSFAQGTVPQNLVYTISTTIGCHGGSNGWCPHIPLKVTMRATPTMTTYGSSGNWQAYIGGVWSTWSVTNVGASDNGIYVDLSGGLATTQGYSYLLRGDYVAVAEL